MQSHLRPFCGSLWFFATTMSTQVVTSSWTLLETSFSSACWYLKQSQANGDSCVFFQKRLAELARFRCDRSFASRLSVTYPQQNVEANSSRTLCEPKEACCANWATVPSQECWECTGWVLSTRQGTSKNKVKCVPGATRLSEQWRSWQNKATDIDLASSFWLPQPLSLPE